MRTRSRTRAADTAAAPRVPATSDGPATRTRSRTTNLSQALAASYDLGNKSSAQRLSSRKFPRDFFNVAFAVLDATSGEMLNYRQLIQRPRRWVSLSTLIHHAAGKAPGKWKSPIIPVYFAA